jgi:plasmid stability protein
MERREEQKTKPMFVRQIPQDLKRKFKVLCAEKGISLQAAVIELMRQWVEEESSDETHQAIK